MRASGKRRLAEARQIHIFCVIFVARASHWACGLVRNCRGVGCMIPDVVGHSQTSSEHGDSSSCTGISSRKSRRKTLLFVLVAVSVQKLYALLHLLSLPSPPQIRHQDTQRPANCSAECLFPPMLALGRGSSMRRR